MQYLFKAFFTVW